MNRPALFLLSILLSGLIVQSQAPAPSRNHPAIAYASSALHDPVSELQRKIENGEVRLKSDEESGYLRSILQALNVPIDSQMAVFSKTSFQSDRINPQNPRTIFFNDSVAVARPREGFIEVASTDPKQGVIFYGFGEFGKAEFRRDAECLVCHISPATLGVPGLAVGSVLPGADGTPLLDTSSSIMDHRSPFDQRWGGWYVTGATGSMQHLGNRVAVKADKPGMPAADKTPSLESLRDKIDITGYLSPYSDIVALMVFEHQAHMTNLMIRTGWQSRVASYEFPVKTNSQANSNSLKEKVNELVDYMLFIDEAPLPNKIRGTSGFAERFQSQGPNDSKRRSLRQLDLERHLMRYPCSYMVYSPAFDGMPAEAKAAVYNRMWQILSGDETSSKYAHLSLNDRKAVVEILRETKTGLPPYFGNVTK